MAKRRVRIKQYVFDNFKVIARTLEALNGKYVKFVNKNDNLQFFTDWVNTETLELISPEDKDYEALMKIDDDYYEAIRKADTRTPEEKEADFDKSIANYRPERWGITNMATIRRVAAKCDARLPSYRR